MSWRVLLIFFLLLAPRLATDPAEAVPTDIPIIIMGPDSVPTPPLPGQCTLALDPAVASILVTTPKGATVSVIVVTSCTGTPTFSAPNFDDGGLFAISGRNVIINPSGPGVSGLAGTTQNATISVAP